MKSHRNSTMENSGAKYGPNEVSFEVYDASGNKALSRCGETLWLLRFCVSSRHGWPEKYSNGEVLPLPTSIFFLFPTACHECGGRVHDHLWINLDPWETWSEIGGYWEFKNRGWRKWTQCCRCGFIYAEEKSFLFDAAKERATIVKKGGLKGLPARNLFVNWSKLEKEGFIIESIPEIIPGGH
jgi:hypothetical protein